MREDVRLLTLTGAPGTGKTRLAIAVAADVHHAFPGGLAFVNLASIEEPRLVSGAIAQAIGLHEVPGQPLHERLCLHLRTRRALLLMDNFEQVLAAASLVVELLERCPELRILVTSREPLHLRWEHELPVPPLALPDTRHLPTLEALAVVPSVGLFVERARAVKPDFALTDENAGAVAETCARLDGLPLAIELAAAQVKSFTPRALLRRLERSRFGLPAGRTLDRPARHGTLRAAVAWSYDLLPRTEQTLLRRLGVFVGGCTLEAAEAVAGSAAPDGLPSLADKSLLAQEPQPDGESRFRLLETIRDYALEQLVETGELAETRCRHAHAYLAFAEDVEPHLWGPDQAAWLERLEAEHGNLRAALRWALEHGDAATAQRTAAAVWRLWDMYGYLGEGRQWLDEALAAGEATPPSLRARVLLAAGMLALGQSDLGPAAALLSRSLGLLRKAGDRAGQVRPLNALGLVAVEQGQLTQARSLFETAVSLATEMGDQRGHAAALNNLGNLGMVEHDYGAARSLFEACLELHRDLGDRRSQAAVLTNLGGLACWQGDLECAAESARKGLLLLHELGDRHSVPVALAVLGMVARLSGDAARAARLFGAAEALGEAIGSPHSPTNQALFTPDVAATRAALGETLFHETWAAGRAMSPAEAVDCALACATPGAPSSTAARRGRSTLTPREEEVAGMVARGMTNHEIAGLLVLSDRTVEAHLVHIRDKLGLRSRSQVAVWATQRVLLTRT